MTLRRAKDAVASMIKRLAHRNANVQLYTLEVRLKSQDGELRVLIFRYSWQTRYHRTVEIRCTESLRQGASRTLYYDLPTIGCAEIISQRASFKNTC